MGVAAVAGGLGVASAYSAYKTNDANIKSQEQYNETLTEDAVRQYSELGKGEVDVIYESHASSLQAQRDAMTAKAEIELGAAYTGTYGSAIDSAMTDIDRGLGSRMSEITRNTEINLDNIDTTAQQIRASAISGASRQVFAPSWVTGLQAGVQTGAAAYSVGSGVAKSRAASRTAQ